MPIFKTFLKNYYNLKLKINLKMYCIPIFKINVQLIQQSIFKNI